MIECPKCHGMLEDDGTCSCGYGVKRRGAAAKKTGPDLCAWNDHGDRCRHRGVIGMSLQGGGSWYCREHWDRMQGYPTTVVGNAVPAYVQSGAGRAWHAAMAEHLANGGWTVIGHTPNLPNPLDEAAG